MNYTKKNNDIFGERGLISFELSHKMGKFYWNNVWYLFTQPAVGSITNDPLRFSARGQICSLLMKIWLWKDQEVVLITCEHNRGILILDFQFCKLLLSCSQLKRPGSCINRMPAFILHPLSRFVLIWSFIASQLNMSQSKYRKWQG